ncbi:MAG: Rieske (2Fe-2S) protein [Actinomycetota bacterium]
MTDARTTDEPIASLDPTSDLFLDVGAMRMTTVDGNRLAVIRTTDGVHALDNACPHQGYGLVTGELGADAAGDAVVTCQWHNWKFRVSDGVCTVGEENVLHHATDVDDRGDVRVTITATSPADRLAALWPSLRSALGNHYVGQLSRDTVRLLDNGATPTDVMTAALAATVDHTEDGVDHEVALAADCLSLSEAATDDDRVLPLVVGLSGLSEQTRGRTAYAPTGQPADVEDLVDLIERERLDEAMVTAAALDPTTARGPFVEAASRHHLGYGHGVIYTQKVFELLDRVGPEATPVLLSQLARSLTLMTREDTLPYMRSATRAIAEVDLDALAALPRTDTDPATVERLVDAFLEADEAPIVDAVVAADDGIGVEGLIDIASIGSARRMLRYDPAIERQTGEKGFGWLQISHGLTHARAARWALHNEPGPAAARIALHAIWLLFDTGRYERRHGVATPVRARGGTHTDRTGGGDTAEAVELSCDAARQAFVERLVADALDDQGGSFIVVAHLVKTAVAAAEEAAATGSSAPLLATAAMIDGDRRERFVARNVAEAIRFVRTGRPPVR